MTRPRPRLVVGSHVELHVRFNDSWSGGFEIDTVLATGYRVRRTHDGALLPDATGEHDVRSVPALPPWP